MTDLISTLADSLVALINASPRSPSKQEIEAVIRKALPGYGSTMLTVYGSASPTPGVDEKPLEVKWSEQNDPTDWSVKDSDDGSVTLTCGATDADLARISAELLAAIEKDERDRKEHEEAMRLVRGVGEVESNPKPDRSKAMQAFGVEQRQIAYDQTWLWSAENKAHDRCPDSTNGTHFWSWYGCRPHLGLRHPHKGCPCGAVKPD